MKKLVGFIVAMSFSAVGFASVRTCVPQKAIVKDDEISGYSYITGMGTNHAEGNALVTLNENVETVLDKAIEEKNPFLEVCLRGSLLETGKDGKMTLLVFAADVQRLKH